MKLKIALILSALIAPFGLFGQVGTYDVKSYGASGSQRTTTGSINSGSTTLTLATAQDFANGQGVLAYHAGPAPTVTTPGGCAVAAQGVTGSTTYAYRVFAIDSNGGSGAACAQVQTTSGNATLGGTTSATVSSFTRTGTTVSVVTSKGVTGIAVGNVIDVTNLTNGDALFNGTFRVASVTDSQHFTYVYAPVNYYGDATVNNPGATVTLRTGNLLTWKAVTGANRYVIFGRTVAGFTYVNQSNVPYLLDSGQSGLVYPPWLLGININAPTNDWLVATIVSGGGTTSLTLNPTASAAASGVVVQHDDTAAVIAALNKSGSATSIGASVIFSKGSYNLGPIAIPGHSNNSLAIFLDGATLNMYGSWIPNSFIAFDGLSGAPSEAFSRYPASRIQTMVGADAPVLYLNAVSSFASVGVAWDGDPYFSDTIDMVSASPACLGNVWITFDHSTASTNGANTTGVPIRITACDTNHIAGFGFFANGSTFNGGTHASNPMAQSAIFLYSFGDVKIVDSFFANYNIQIVGGAGISNLSAFEFENILSEDTLTDFIMATGGWGYKLERIDMADAVRGGGILFAIGSGGPEDVTILNIDGAVPTDNGSEGVFNGLYYTTGTSTAIMDPPSTGTWARFNYTGGNPQEGLFTVNAARKANNAIWVKQGLSTFQDLRAQHLISNGPTPACSVTGAGTGASCSVRAASTDNGGSIEITAGTTPSASGTATLLFSSPFPSNAFCTFDLSNSGSKSWQPRATATVASFGTTQNMANWDNNTVALVVSANYDINYVCMGGR